MGYFISAYAIDVCIDKPVHIFEPHPDINIETLLSKLRLGRGAGGGFVRLVGENPAGKGRDVPSDLLYIVKPDDSIEVVGAVAEVEGMIYQFAIRTDRPKEVLRARQLGTFIETRDPWE